MNVLPNGLKRARKYATGRASNSAVAEVKSATPTVQTRLRTYSVSVKARTKFSRVKAGTGIHITPLYSSRRQKANAT